MITDNLFLEEIIKDDLYLEEMIKTIDGYGRILHKHTHRQQKPNSMVVMLCLSKFVI